MSYRGEWANLTEAQYDYNKALEQYNRLKELGIKDTEFLDKYIATTEANTKNIIRKTQIEISDLNKQILEGTTLTYKELYSIQNGIVVLNSRLLEGMTSAQIESAQIALSEMQELYNQQLEAFMTIRDAQIELAKEEAAEKKKIYEKIFWWFR